MVCCFALEQKKLSPSITCFPYWGRQAQQWQILHSLQYPLCICNCSHSLTLAMRKKWYVKTKVKSFANLNNHSQQCCACSSMIYPDMRGFAKNNSGRKIWFTRQGCLPQHQELTTPINCFQILPGNTPSFKLLPVDCYGLLSPKP